MGLFLPKASLNSSVTGVKQADAAKTEEKDGEQKQKMNDMLFGLFCFP